MKTHADKIREALIDLGEASPREVMDWISQHYPGEPVNEVSYRSDMIALASNHSSSHHYPGMKPKFLLFNEETKKYRINPSETYTLTETENVRADPFLKKLPEAQIKPPLKIDDDSNCIDGIPVAKLSVTGQIAIPPKIREKLDLSVGDTIAFIINEAGNVEIKKARIKLELT
jgi:AbrB family looped-hinge helix DNA binding protein